jgi:hypothetical protein
MKRRTFRAEREFGLLVGAVFSLVGAWWFYRGKFAIAAYVFTIAGPVLIVLGATLPNVLVVPRRFWMKLAEGLSYVSSRVILAIIFFLVLTPIGLVKRALGWDPLQRRSGSRDSFWHPYPPRNSKHYERMY